MNVNNCYMLSEKMVFFSMILTSYQVSLLFAITQAGEGGEWGGEDHTLCSEGGVPTA